MIQEEISSIKNKTIETLRSYFIEDAQEIIASINELKKNPEVSKNGDLVEELTIYEALMKFIAFSTLPENDQLELFKNYLVKAFRIGLDVKNRFAIKMNLTPDVLWPETVQIFIEAILKNNERLGKKPILVRGEKENSLPVLSSWLRDYNRIYGMDRHEEIIPHRYLAESQNAQSLDSEERVLLLKILEFYEALKFPSQSQIQAALENALNQYIEADSDLLADVDSYEGSETIRQVREDLNSAENDYQDNDIENLIKKFPKVTDQQISKNPIKLLFNGENVPPTISNWLADYRAYAGVGNHEINERSDYLLRSPNVQNLAPEERERLGLLLRSYDEKYLLPFSVSKQAIIFDKVKAGL